MDRIIIVLVLITVALIGLMDIRRDIKALSDDLEFTNQFLVKLKEFITSHGDPAVYTWLLMRCDRMQVQLGAAGLVSFRPPFMNVEYRNYPLILNLLPELNRAMGEAGAGERIAARHAHDYAAMLQEAVIRRGGVLQFQLDNIGRKATNPLVWFTRGVQWLIAMPLLVLVSIGIVSSSAISRVSSSPLFRVISGLVALIGLVSAVIGIITGWEPFVLFIRRAFNMP